MVDLVEPQAPAQPRSSSRPSYHDALWDHDTQARFWAYVQKGTSSECWSWKGGTTPGGYGTFYVQRFRYAAHRLLKIKMSYADHSDLVCDHLCRNRGCVNPSHIELVTNAENVRRGIAGALNKLKGRSVKECRNGHPYTPENTIYNPRGSRTCRQCQYRYAIEYKRRRKARALSSDARDGQGEG